MAKSVGLDFTNKAHDIPFRISAFGKMGGGECAIILMPNRGFGVLLHLEGSTARVWRSTSKSDCPKMPDEQVQYVGSETLVHPLMAEVSEELHNITLRGNWSGKLLCTEAGPVIELARKVASYAVLNIRSIPQTTTWEWKLVRPADWFGPASESQGLGRTLKACINEAAAQVAANLGEVCGVRDSRRRAAFDEGYREKHPIIPAPEPKNPKVSKWRGVPEPVVKPVKVPTVKTPTVKVPTVKPAKEPKPPKDLRQSEAANLGGGMPPVTRGAARRPAPPTPYNPESSASPFESAGAPAPASDVPVDPKLDGIILNQFEETLKKTMAGFMSS